MKVTSAIASKILKRLNEKKDELIYQERMNNSYVATDTETPVIPEFDYRKNFTEIANIDTKILEIKHRLNVVNSTNILNINGVSYTIDEILVRMAQLNNRKSCLSRLCNRPEKERIGARSGTNLIEYKYLNYDPKMVKNDYELLDKLISDMQLALDKFNQTYEFDIIDIE